MHFRSHKHGTNLLRGLHHEDQLPLDGNLKRVRARTKPSWLFFLIGARESGGGSLSATRFLVDGGEIAAFHDIVAVRFLADLIKDPMCFGIMMKGLSLIATQAKRLSLQIVVPGN